MLSDRHTEPDGPGWRARLHKIGEVMATGGYSLLRPKPCDKQMPLSSVRCSRPAGHAGEHRGSVELTWR